MRMLFHARFEFDPDKAESNSVKHGVTFEDAMAVLSDPDADRFHLEEPQDHEGEDRWLTFASHPLDRSLILAVVWTLRGDEREPVTRIISARKAGRKERLLYEEAQSR